MCISGTCEAVPVVSPVRDRFECKRRLHSAASARVLFSSVAGCMWASALVFFRSNAVSLVSLVGETQ